MRTLKNHRLGQHYAHSIMLSGARPFQYRRSVSRLINSPGASAMSRPVDFFHAMGLNYLKMPQQFALAGSNAHQGAVMGRPVTDQQDVQSVEDRADGLHQTLTKNLPKDTTTDHFSKPDTESQGEYDLKSTKDERPKPQSQETARKTKAKSSLMPVRADSKTLSNESHNPALPAKEVGDFLAQLGQSLEAHNRAALSDAPNPGKQTQTLHGDPATSNTSTSTQQLSETKVKPGKVTEAAPRIQRKAMQATERKTNNSALNRSFELDSGSKKASAGPSSFSIETSDYSKKLPHTQKKPATDKLDSDHKQTVNKTKAIQDAASELPEIPNNTNDYRQMAQVLSKYVQPANLTQTDRQSQAQMESEQGGQKQVTQEKPQKIIRETRQVRQSRIAAPVNASESSFQRHYCGHSNIRMYKW